MENIIREMFNDEIQPISNKYRYYYEDEYKASK